MPEQMYVPQFQNTMRTIGDVRMNKQTGRLAQQAMAGSPDALQQLYALNPQFAAGLQDQLSKMETNKIQGRYYESQIAGNNALAAQRQAQSQAAAADALRQEEENRQADEDRLLEIVNGLAEKASKYESFEEAKGPMQREMDMLLESNPDLARVVGDRTFDEDDYNEARTVFAEDDDLADQRERKIAQYQKHFNMSIEDATRAVDEDIRVDPISGNLIVYDRIAGEGRIADIDRGAAPDAAPEAPPVSLEDLAFDPGKGTGFGASFLGLWNRTVGQIPYVPEAMVPEESAQHLRLLERDAIRALATSARPPIVEQERIMALVPNAMAWTENPEVARFQMTNFIDLMMNQYVDDMRFSSDQNNPSDVRDSSGERARAIEGIVRRTLTPEAAEQMFQTFNNTEAEISEIRTMSDEDLLAIDLDKANLTPAQLDIYIERLRGM